MHPSRLHYTITVTSNSLVALNHAVSTFHHRFTEPHYIVCENWHTCLIGRVLLDFVPADCKMIHAMSARSVTEVEYLTFILIWKLIVL
jgi:hypothetical protein